jgi:hypothetical protein
MNTYVQLNVDNVAVAFSHSDREIIGSILIDSTIEPMSVIGWTYDGTVFTAPVVEPAVEPLVEPVVEPTE